MLIRREPNITYFMYVLSFLSRDVSAPGCFSPGSFSLHKVSTSGRSVPYHIGPGTFPSWKFLSQANLAPGVFGPGKCRRSKRFRPETLLSEEVLVQGQFGLIMFRLQDVSGCEFVFSPMKCRSRDLSFRE